MTSSAPSNVNRIILKNKWTDITPSLPAAAQRDSIFCSIPSDIRWLILRELLRSPEPLNLREGYLPQDQDSDLHKLPVVKDRYLVSGHHLTPSILRSCQLLFREGLRILYRQNTLCIRSFYRQSFPHSKLSHVNTSLYIPTSKMHHPWYSSTCCYAKYDSFNLDHQTHKFVRKFCRFKLLIDPDRSPDLFRLILSGVFEVLESVFRGASVILAIDKKCREAARLLPEDTAWPYTLLSCGRYQIEGRDPAQATTILNFSRKEERPTPRDKWPRNAFWRMLYASKDGARETKAGLLASSIIDSAWGITRSCIQSSLANITDTGERQQRKMELERELNNNISRVAQEWNDVESELKRLQEGDFRYWWRLKHIEGHAFM